MEDGKQAANPARHLDLLQESNAPTMPARDRDAIALYEPPGFCTLLFRDGSEQNGNQRISQGQESQIPPVIEPGDEPRRPTAEPSVIAEDEHWAG